MDRRKAYSTTCSKLELKTATEKTPRHLNSLVSVKEPEHRATLDLDLTYDAGFIEHLFETDEKTFGYTPSSWLRVILSEDSPLHLPLGNAQVPIPIRQYVVSFRNAYADKKQLDVYADGKDLWPGINGASCKGEGPSTD